MDLITFYILIIIFVATLVRSTFGFGQALIAVPLLILIIPIEVVVPLITLTSILIAAVVIVQDRKQIYFKSAKWLILFAILGIPLGLYILTFGNEAIIKTLLGILIIVYAVYALCSKNNLKLKVDNKKWLFVCGFLSGILGGAYGLNGPPLIFYGNIRSWSAKKFRATLQAYFLPVSSIGMFGYWYNGLWDATVTYYFLITIPVVLPAIFLGRYFNNKLKDGSFLKYIYFGLIFIGVALLVQSLI